MRRTVRSTPLPEFHLFVCTGDDLYTNLLFNLLEQESDCLIETKLCGFKKCNCEVNSAQCLKIL